MLKNVNPTTTTHWKKLAGHFEKVKDFQMKEDNPPMFP